MKLILFTLLLCVLISAAVVSILKWSDYAGVERQYQGVAQMSVENALWLSSGFGDKGVVDVMPCVEEGMVLVGYKFSVSDPPEYLNTLGLSYTDHLVEGGAQIVLIFVISTSFVVMIMLAALIREE